MEVAVESDNSTNDTGDESHDDKGSNSPGETLTSKEMFEDEMIPELDSLRRSESNEAENANQLEVEEEEEEESESMSLGHESETVQDSIVHVVQTKDKTERDLDIPIAGPSTTEQPKVGSENRNDDPSKAGKSESAIKIKQEKGAAENGNQVLLMPPAQVPETELMNYAKPRTKIYRALKALSAYNNVSKKSSIAEGAYGRGQRRIRQRKSLEINPSVKDYDRKIGVKRENGSAPKATIISTTRKRRLSPTASSSQRVSAPIAKRVKPFEIETKLSDTMNKMSSSAPKQRFEDLNEKFGSATKTAKREDPPHASTSLKSKRPPPENGKSLSKSNGLHSPSESPKKKIILLKRGDSHGKSSSESSVGHGDPESDSDDQPRESDGDRRYKTDSEEEEMFKENARDNEYNVIWEKTNMKQLANSIHDALLLLNMHLTKWKPKMYVKEWKNLAKEAGIPLTSRWFQLEMVVPKCLSNVPWGNRIEKLKADAPNNYVFSTYVINNFIVSEHLPKHSSEEAETTANVIRLYEETLSKFPQEIFMHQNCDDNCTAGEHGFQCGQVNTPRITFALRFLGIVVGAVTCCPFTIGYHGPKATSPTLPLLVLEIVALAVVPEAQKLGFGQLVLLCLRHVGLRLYRDSHELHLSDVGFVTRASSESAGWWAGERENGFVSLRALRRMASEVNVVWRTTLANSTECHMFYDHHPKSGFSSVDVCSFDSKIGDMGRLHENLDAIMNKLLFKINHGDNTILKSLGYRTKHDASKSSAIPSESAFPAAGSSSGPPEEESLGDAPEEVELEHRKYRHGSHKKKKKKRKRKKKSGEKKLSSLKDYDSVIDLQTEDEIQSEIEVDRSYSFSSREFSESKSGTTPMPLALPIVADVDSFDEDEPKKVGSGSNLFSKATSSSSSLIGPGPSFATIDRGHTHEAKREQTNLYPSTPSVPPHRARIMAHHRDTLQL